MMSLANRLEHYLAVRRRFGSDLLLFPALARGIPT